MNTTETNKKFAEFLEWEVNNIETIAPEEFRTMIPFKTIYRNEYFTTTIFKNEELKFHNDWNWLMLVVEKIANTQGFYDVENDLKDLKITSDIQIVYNACNAFVDWYNSNKV